MLDHKALNAALFDLAEYGWVILESAEDARQVRKACPRQTTLIATTDASGTTMYMVELAPEPHDCQPNKSIQTGAAKTIAAHVISLLLLIIVGVGIARLLLWLIHVL